LQLNAYGDGTFTGTPTYLLAADTNGNIIETGLGGYWTRTGTELTPATSGDNVEVTVTGSTTAIQANADTGIAVSATAGGNYAVYGKSTGTYGVYAVREDASTDTILDAGGIGRRTTATAANGIGVNFSMDVENASGFHKQAVKLTALLNDVTNASEDAEFRLGVREAGSVVNRIKVKDGETYIGDVDNSNYSKFSSNGTYQAYGTATTWDDQQVELGAVRLGSSSPTWTAYKGGEVLSFAKNLDNKIFFNCQLTHRYKEDSTIHFHIHFTVPDNNTGDTKWVLTYSWSDIGSKFPAQQTEPKIVSIAANSQDTHLVDEIYAPVPGTGQGGFSSMLICSLMREGSDDADTYDAAAYLVGIDFHVEMDKLGTASEYSDAETTTTS